MIQRALTDTHDGGRRISRRQVMWLLTGLVIVSSSGCGNDVQSSLDPASPDAERIGTLWWVMLIIGAIVFLIVMALAVIAIRHGRPTNEAGEAAGEGDTNDGSWVVAGGIVIPGVILVALFIFTMLTLSSLSSASGDEDALVINVTGNRWWWEVRYPDLDIVTANEIHIPVGRPVELRLDSDNVIHSFWVPALHGKRDMIPGQTTTLWIEADEPGFYRGQCAEFCGIQHAKMAFYVVAESDQAFTEWVDRTYAAAVEPAGDAERRGQAAFAENCAVCHTIRGTVADGTVGPDLTHFGSRLTIAAGTLPNTPGNLGGWIADPQHIKEGALMPNVPLSPAELTALIAYLESLE